MTRHLAGLSAAALLVAACLFLPAELAYQRGYYAMNNAPQPHWKYFWFD